MTNEVDMEAREPVPGSVEAVAEGEEWPFLPGDRVRCTVPLPEGTETLDGTVTRISIPGPITPHKVIQVTLDENTPIKVSWWDPSRVERITS
jgi:hypothetical protein